MKRTFSLVACFVCIFAFVSCQKYDDTELRQRLEKLEGTTIATINEQIAAIENTIGILQKADTTFESEIGSLRTYVDDCRTSDRSWVETTYSTLAQYGELMDSLLAKDSLQSARTAQAVVSMQSWVNESLTGYYDIASVNAKLAALEKKMTFADSVSTDGIEKLRAALSQASTDLTTAYRQAISEAISTSNGIINKSIADSINAVNTRIDSEVAAINLRIATLEGRIGALEESVRELQKKLDISFSDNDVSCSAGDIVKIGYKIINGSVTTSIYTICENGWKTTVTTLTDSTGTITVTAPSPFIDGTVLVFLNDQNKSCIKALNFIEGSMTVSTDVVEVGAAGGSVSVNIDTDLQYTVSIQDDVTWLHTATVTTRSVMRHESITLIADASSLAFPRNAVVRLLNAAGAVIAQYTVRQAGTASSHEYVDLGLSVKWATCNVGATSPEGYGDYFAWGATEPWYQPGYAQSATPEWKTGKSGGYNWANAPYQTANTTSYSSTKWTKYLGSTTSAYKDESATDADALKTVLDLSDDAARANWGGDWRMPTIAEFQELEDNCTWTWTTLNGKNGYKVVSKSNGNFIFLPAAGCRDGTGLYSAGSYGYYWSSSLCEGDPSYAGKLDFYSGGRDTYYSEPRCGGHSVRPVHPYAVTSVSLNRTTVEVMSGGWTALTATVVFENGATSTAGATWSSNNTGVATVDGNGVVTAVSLGECTVTATCGGISATCTVTVKPFEPECVDLGLSVKWATCNVGATSPEGYGDYFAWGATEPWYQPGYAQSATPEWKTGKSDGYNWANAPYQTVNTTSAESTKWTKYLGSTTSTYKDESATSVDALKTILDLSDDVARANWGGDWRMPTIAEFQELEDNCTWTWTTLNGKNGYKVVSKSNGNFIFLPAAGYRDGTGLYSAGSSGDYWSSSLLEIRRGCARCLLFSSGYRVTQQDGRYCGHSVRPVRPCAATSVSLNRKTVEVMLGGWTVLTATVVFENGATSTARATWSSNNTSVATVDGTGVVTAVSLGECTVTATYGGISATCTVTVKPFEPECVDLGLSVKWATCNVGATSPEGYGDYFAWGATEPWYQPGYAQSASPEWKTGKSGGYNWVNTPYQTANTTSYSSTKWTKYLGSTTSNYKDVSATDADALKTVLDLSDDAARANWGGDWRMPTIAEFRELKDSCTWTWYGTGNTEFGGVAGYKVTSKKSGYEGNFIFLPAAGYRDGTGLYSAGSSGDYWSSSLYGGNPGYARYLYFNSGFRNTDYDNRYCGRSVRPVRPCAATSVSLNRKTVEVMSGGWTVLTATVVFENGATSTAGATWSSNNTGVATVDVNGVVTAVSLGECTVTATCGGISATCTVTVKPFEPEYVDLGLSVKWATCNVGANSPEEYGDYFAWGATEPWYQPGYAQSATPEWKTGKSGGYNWVNTPYQTVNTTSYSSTKWTKYLGSTTSDYKDVSATDADALKTVLDLSDDAARANWGGDWRMPTIAEFQELIDSCTWTWTTVNGKKGYKVVSKSNGNFIFLPEAGFRYDSSLYDAGSYGSYWSSSLDESDPYFARGLYFHSGFRDTGSYYRYCGDSVRPVRK